MAVSAQLSKTSHKPAKEQTIKEYPNVTYWLEGRQVLGWGNLILTNERLLFLNRIPELPDWQAEQARKLSAEGDFSKMVDFTLKLHKKNFQIPLSSITVVRMGVFTYIPLPKLCLRIQYLTPKRNQAETGFWFRIPILKGFVEIELQLVLGWIFSIKSAVKKSGIQS